MMNGEIGISALCSSTSSMIHVQFTPLTSAKCLSVQRNTQLPLGASVSRERCIAAARDGSLMRRNGGGGERRGSICGLQRSYHRGNAHYARSRRFSAPEDLWEVESINKRGGRTRYGFERSQSVEESRRIVKCSGRDESLASSEEEKSKKVGSASGSSSSSGKGEGPSKGFVEKVEAELAKQFGGVLWFSVLLAALAFFGGGYAYFIINYADYSDIPILQGPRK